MTTARSRKESDGLKLLRFNKANPTTLAIVYNLDLVGLLVLEDVKVMVDVLEAKHGLKSITLNDML